MSDTQPISIEESIESLLLVHRQANWDKNLGQYKSEHKCECGYTFISDGHLENHSPRIMMAEHVTSMLLDLIQTHTSQQIKNTLEQIIKDYAELYKRISKQHGVERPVPHTAFHQIIEDILKSKEGEES